MTLAIAIANEKGGVGKTTTALSLGAALTELQQRVLLIDLDPQANLTLGVGLRPGAAPGSIADLLLGDATLEDLASETEVPGLWIVPASDELLQAERFLPVRQDFLAGVFTQPELLPELEEFLVSHRIEHPGGLRGVAETVNVGSISPAL